jgi:hypothetical protein
LLLVLLESSNVCCLLAAFLVLALILTLTPAFSQDDPLANGGARAGACIGAGEGSCVKVPELAMLSIICCLLSVVCCLLSAVYCLLSAGTRIGVGKGGCFEVTGLAMIPPLCAIGSLLSAVCSMLYIVCCLRAHASALEKKAASR